MARAIGSEDFDPVDFYTAVLADDRIVVLSDQKVYPATVIKDINKTLADIAEELARTAWMPRKKRPKARSP